MPYQAEAKRRLPITIAIEGADSILGKEESEGGDTRVQLDVIDVLHFQVEWEELNGEKNAALKTKRGTRSFQVEKPSDSAQVWDFNRRVDQDPEIARRMVFILREAAAVLDRMVSAAIGDGEE